MSLDSGSSVGYEVTTGAARSSLTRELNEEPGYHPFHLEPIATFYPSPGGSSERLHLFYAEVSETGRTGPGGGLDSEHEDIEVIELSIDELRARLDAGELVDAKTIIAAQWLLSRHRPPAPM